MLDFFSSCAGAQLSYPFAVRLVIVVTFLHALSLSNFILLVQERGFQAAIAGTILLVIAFLSLSGGSIGGLPVCCVCARARRNPAL